MSGQATVNVTEWTCGGASGVKIRDKNIF